MRFEKQEFRNKRITLNGNEFDQCKFHDCEMVVTGVGSIGLTGNRFNNCRWMFDGPSLATVRFMKALYAMGAERRDLILSTFKEVAPDIKFDQPKP
jgi:hypothetical protein